MSGFVEKHRPYLMRRGILVRVAERGLKNAHPSRLGGLSAISQPEETILSEARLGDFLSYYST